MKSAHMTISRRRAGRLRKLTHAERELRRLRRERTSPDREAAKRAAKSGLQIVGPESLRGLGKSDPKAGF